MGLGRDREFETLLGQHGPMLRRIAGSYEADPERRRELEQDILLAVWRALPRFRGEAPVRAFLARVAHNRARNALIGASPRKRGRARQTASRMSCSSSRRRSGSAS